MSEAKYKTIVRRFLLGVKILICLAGADIIIASFIKPAQHAAGLAWMVILVVFLFYMITAIVTLSILKRKIIKVPAEQKQNV